jgi:pimeloyl-ACP methyl ester carboxylesterase
MGGERSAPRPRRYFVDTAQGFVHVQDCGTGERVLVFLSITSFGGVLLDQVLPALARRGYRALAIDLMGYGLSDKRQHDWSIAEFADNVLDAVTLAGVIPVGYVSGHFAGLVGLEIAARAPAGLRAAVLDGLPFLEPDKRVTPESFQQLNPDMALPVQPGHKLRAAYLAYLAVACFDPGPAFAFQTFDSERRMADIALPCLLICAQTDWNRKHLERWASGIAGSQTLALPGTHPLHDLVNQERADQYVK